MPSQTLLIISTDRTFALGLQQHMQTAFPGMDVLLANNLMVAYNQAEAAQPGFAFIEDGFTRLPEFEMMMALFSALDVRWVSVLDTPGAQPARRATPLLNMGAGIFELSKADGPAQFAQVYGMMVNAPRRHQQQGRAEQGPAGGYRKFLLIGASTGGVEALRSLLVGFPIKCPPTLIVQHTGKSFGRSLVSLLDRICPARVAAAEDGMRLEPGHVYFAAGLPVHMGLVRRAPLRVQLKEGPPISGHTPSVDALFTSALPHAKDVVAAILTGMGQDGARGMLELRRAGAATFAQDEKSSVVYGMPRVAWENGGAQSQVPLADMAATLLQACKG